MFQDNLLLSLIVFTFGAVLVFFVYQWFKATKARREHHHSVKERQDATPGVVRAPAAVPASGMPEQAAQPRKFR